MPKDEPNLLEGALGIGHRHDWENIVVVLSAESTDATLIGMAASYHGDYNVCSGTGCDEYLSGTNPLIQYYSAALLLDHSLGFTTTVGGTQPLISWDELPTVAQEALTDKDWGGAYSRCLEYDVVLLLTIHQMRSFLSSTRTLRAISRRRTDTWTSNSLA